MFLKATAINETVTSGSTTVSDLFDVSGYSKLWIETAVSGNIAGTGSLYLTSISQQDAKTGPENRPEFGLGQPPAQELPNDGSSGWSYVSGSIYNIDAKWAVYSWTETSGSAVGTGSVIVKWSLLT